MELASVGVGLGGAVGVGLGGALAVGVRSPPSLEDSVDESASFSLSVSMVVTVPSRRALLLDSPPPVTALPAPT